MKGNGKMIKEVDLELLFSKMGINTKVSLKMTNLMEKVYFSYQKIAIDMKEILKITIIVGKVPITME